jgi:arylsulfatase A-like enzyme
MALPTRRLLAATAAIATLVTACPAPTPDTPPEAEPVTEASPPLPGLLPLDDALRLTDVEPTHVRIGNDRRPAVLMPPGTVRAATVAVPPDQPTLRLAYGIAEDAGELCRTPLRFMAQASTGENAPTTLIDERVDPYHQRWFEAAADLSRWHGREVTLQVRFDADEAGGGTCPVPVGAVGDVRVVSGDDEALARDTRPDIWIVLVDALRTDHVGYMGSTVTHTPAMDELAEQSIRFERAYAGSPWTLESVLMMTSGTYLTAGISGPRGPSDLRIPPHVPCAVDRLADAGYRPLSLYANEMMAPGSGFERSFASHSFINMDHELPGRLQALVGDGDPREPQLVYLHLIGPHMPYVFHPGATERHLLRAGRAGTGPVSFDDWHHLTLEEVDDDERALVGLYYRAEVEVADEVVGELVQVIDRQEIRRGRPTWVIFTSDHGEELWDHGGFEHGHTMYDELLHVPLAVRPPLDHPLRAAGEDVSTPVSLIDVGHTLVELAGAEALAPPAGRSLAPWLGPEPPAPASPRTLLAMGVIYGAPEVAIIRGDHKQIRTHGREPAYQQFDLDTDPGEQIPGEDGTGEWSRFDREWATVQQLAVSGTLTLRAWLRPRAQGELTLTVCHGGGMWVDPVSTAAANVEVGQRTDGCTPITVRGQAPVAVDLQLDGLREAGPRPTVAIGTNGAAMAVDRIRWPAGSSPAGDSRMIPLPWDHHEPLDWPEALPDELDAVVQWAPRGHAVPAAVELPDPLKERLQALGYYER